MDIIKLTVCELQEKLQKNEIKIDEIYKAYMDNIEKEEEKVEAFITINHEGLNKAIELQKRKEDGEELGEFAGIPIGIKDNICTKGIKTTCASKMLQDFISPYDASVVEKLNNEDIISLGKLNMDEFAMGGQQRLHISKKLKILGI